MKTSTEMSIKIELSDTEVLRVTKSGFKDLFHTAYEDGSAYWADHDLLHWKDVERKIPGLSKDPNWGIMKNDK